MKILFKDSKADISMRDDEEKNIPPKASLLNPASSEIQRLND
jgi:hypothetical protein